MIDSPDLPCERRRLFKAIDDAFKAGDFSGLGEALGGSERWFDEEMPVELGLGHPLEYAIYWSPAELVTQLLDAGSNPNYSNHAGYPSILAVLSTDRADKLDILVDLLHHGADPNGRGVNDWTPLHYAVSRRDAEAIRILLEAGADPSLKTTIDDCTSAVEEAEHAGFEAGALMLRQAAAMRDKRR